MSAAADRIRAAMDEEAENVIDLFRPATVRSYAELMGLDIEPRPTLLAPILRNQDLAMIHGPRGTGKTLLGLSIGWAVATGGTCLRWSAGAAAPVLYVDGEMPLSTLQERLARIAAGAPTTLPADRIPFRILAADDQETAIPTLSTPAGQRVVEPHLEGVRLLVVDNISTLLSTDDENDAAAWTEAQQWLLSLRRQGIAVLLIHHSGKNGGQRGTSRREDVLDLVLGLRRPCDYHAQDGARFEIHTEKARGLTGDAVEPFEVQLEVGRMAEFTWSYVDLETEQRNRALSMLNDGMPAAAVAAELKVHRASVYRWRKAMKGDK